MAKRTIEVLDAVARAAAEAGQPQALLAAVETAAGEMIDHRLFTVMKLHRDTLEVERLHSSRPEVYPPGGRKAKQGTPWGTQVLVEGRPWICRDAGDIREVFDDHATIAELGLSTMLNMPVMHGGRVLGTMNLSGGEGAYDESHLPAARVLASMLLPALLPAP